MSSKIKATNSQGKTLTIENIDSVLDDVSITSKDLAGIKSVDTLADLRTMKIPVDKIWVSGYHNKNDGAFGSHIFRLKGVKTTETDNGGTIIIANIGGVDYVYELQFDGAVNVKWFGAIGDGITDDTIYFKKALDEHGSIFAPKNTYYIKGLERLTAETWHIEGEEGTILTSLDSSNILKVGTIDASWGSSGMISLKNITFTGASDWNSLVSIDYSGLVELYSTSNINMINVVIQKSKSIGLYVKNTGYSTITGSNFLACNFDTVFLDSTLGTNATTSVHIDNSRMSTGLRSGIKLNKVFNVSITKSQLEDNETAMLITGTSANTGIVFEENYVEATRGDYDIDFRTASGDNMSICNNYLFGSPSVSTLGINTNGAVNFTKINYSNNKGTTSQPLHLGFISTDWLLGSRSSEGVAEVTIAKATTAAQQTSIVNIATENNYGTSIKTSSITGSYLMGLTRGTGIKAIDDGQAFISQASNNKGGINILPTESYGLHIYGGSGSGKNQNSLKCSHVGGSVLYTGGLGYTMSGTPSTTTSALYISHPNNTGRSVNASGTVNAAGADYAEYENNNGLTILKGDIIGFNINGNLTDKFIEAYRFAVKSTDPSYVGGDVWAKDLGERPTNMTKEQLTEEEEIELANLQKEFDEKLELARNKVDRVAYAGKVPVNVFDCKVGDYIIATNSNNSITGTPKSSPTFEEYKKCVGRVNRILEDGRAEIAVIIH